MSRTPHPALRTMSHLHGCVAPNSMYPPRAIYHGAELEADRMVGGSPRSSPFERSTSFDAFSKPPAPSLSTSSLAATSTQSTSSSFPPTINSIISSVATGRENSMAGESITSTQPPAHTPVVPAPTPSPARMPVVPVPTLSPARTPIPPPACTPVAPTPTPPPACMPVVPTPSAARPPTPPPAPAIPHYLVSRPMANAPKGHPLAAPAAAQVTVPATKRKPGRPRENHVEPAVEMGMGSVGGMTPEARAESDRIHREEAQLRETRKEMLRRERVVEERAAATKAEGLRLAALVHNPARGAPLTIIKCSSHVIKVTLDPEGNPLIHPVGTGGRLALRVLGSNALQAQEDTEMLEKLSGKKAAGTKTSVGQQGGVEGGDERKASDTIPVGELAAK
ncbi:hypothetical protein B0H14DRAFT_2626037 [Mycena olivaceomarginata]|nr:hypothetical protein B0H14DRAFT_2626037 [Mycena olivaceomarginata]